jgi:glycosyltransferase involved in cell wall biosynthesis
MKISIATPNYNYAEYVTETVESVTAQTGVAIEHVIVDDGSTDDSVRVIQQLQLKHPNLFLIQQKNQGQTPAINCGIRKCSGDILGWINSDDTYCLGVFKTVADFFEANPEVDVVFGDANVVDLKGRFIYRIRHMDISYRTGAYAGFTNVMTSNAIFWRRSAMERSGLLKDELRCNMDGEFFARLLYRAKAKHLPVPVANFRQQPFTKAAEKNPKWERVVQEEILLERLTSYDFLPESKIIPYRFSFPLKMLFRLIRVARRSVRLHYLKKWVEVKNYRAASALKEPSQTPS